MSACVTMNKLLASCDQWCLNWGFKVEAPKTINKSAKVGKNFIWFYNTVPPCFGKRQKLLQVEL